MNKLRAELAKLAPQATQEPRQAQSKTAAPQRIELIAHVEGRESN